MPIPLGKSLVAKLKSDKSSSNYPKNWGSISAAFRKERRYKCKICGVDCCDHPGLTDAHHINGDKSNCNYKNLQCLCKYCHWQQPQHRHYNPTEAQMKILRRLWQEQNLPDPSQKE